MEGMSCNICGDNAGFDCEEDGFYYCRNCNSQVEDMIETGVEKDFMDKANIGGNSQFFTTSIKTEPVTLLSQPESQHHNFWRTDGYKVPKEEEQPSIPNDFGARSQLSPDDLSSEIRIRYVMGIQRMIQFQCQVMMENFGASPLICGLAGVIWMRFVAASRVFDEHWADKMIEDSEVQKKGVSKEHGSRSQHINETTNLFGQSTAMIWFRSLRKRIPISSSLAVSFLACHVAREPILPTDICKWSLEGKLPYLTAFIDIEKSFGCLSSVCPISSSVMFKPFRAVRSRELESQSGFVAQTIGLQLPPVNFHAIARRYLKQLSLPVDKILPHAARIYEWSMPPDLWLSANSKRLPTRVCVMSIIMATIRILYNINGFGKWEASLSSTGTPCKSKKRKNASNECSQLFDPKDGPEKKKYNTRCSRSSSLNKMASNKIRGLLHIQDSDFDTAELLCNLEATYDKTHCTYEYQKDLPTYLKYCKDFVFAGLTPLLEDNEEERIIEKFWNYYENQEDSEAVIGCNSSPRQARSADNGCSSPVSMDNDNSTSADGMGTECSLSDDCDSPMQEEETLKLRAVKRMKLNMEENGFCYIPPRVKLKRFDYLHYIRKNDEGSRSYVAHADYYILLRACAQVAEVNVRYMHAGELKFEKGLSWIENRIDQSLHFRSQNPSPFDSRVDL